MHKTLQPSPKSPDETSDGFTLIELSIVLVIIGLIVGGVLVGQNLIKAAGIRATMRQVEKFTSSINTFRTKYNYLPGDMPSNVASQLGFFALSTTSGNFVLNDGLVSANEGEPMWRHLSEAQLIDGSYGFANGGLDPAIGAPLVGTATVEYFLPPSKLSRAAYFYPWADITKFKNYFILTDLSFVNVGGGYNQGPASLIALDMYAMDVKMDDGLPSTGTVTEWGSDPHCTTTGGTVYNVSYGSPTNCMMLFRW